MDGWMVILMLMLMLAILENELNVLKVFFLVWLR